MLVGGQHNRHRPLDVREAGIEHRPAGTRGIDHAVVHQQDQRINAVVCHRGSKPRAGFATHPDKVRLLSNNGDVAHHVTGSS